MKRTFYLSIISTKRFIILSLASMLVFGAAVKAQTYTIDFSAHPPPPTNDPTVDQNDHLNSPFVPQDAIETGVRFRVTQPGTITGIRFYKGNLITGIHIGHLWTNTGTQLAQATFSETANGWQEVAVSVHINAGVNYVASVFNDIGDYAAEPLGSYSWNNPASPPPHNPPNDYGSAPIKVIRSSNDPAGNGVFIYLFNATNPTGAFPTQGGGNGTNFWIDVRFQPDFSLPVTITDFKATTTNNNILLNWKTESESNNDGFELQRSNNGTDWYAIGFVKGAGQSSAVKNYGYTDKSLAPGLYYYRLKQIDFDGNSKISAVVTASVTGKGKVSLFQNTPNPFNAITTIRFDLPKAQKVKLSVFDMTGKEIKVLTNKVSESGSHLVTLDAATLNRQVYLVKLQTEDGVLTKTILVQ